MTPSKPSIGHIVSLAGKLSLEDLDSLIKVLTAYRDSAVLASKPNFFTDYKKKD
jgi:hypothetical protein